MLSEVVGAVVQLTRHLTRAASTRIRSLDTAERIVGDEALGVIRGLVQSEDHDLTAVSIGDRKRSGQRS